MSFESQIKQWVSVDNEIKIYNEKLKELREKRNTLTDNITKYADSNNLSNSTVQISDGKLKFAHSKVIEPLSFTYLEKHLGGIIKSDDHVKKIIEHLKNKRTSKIVPEIKRYSNN